MYYLYVSDAGAATAGPSDVMYAQIQLKELDKKKRSNSQPSHKLIQNAALFFTHKKSPPPQNCQLIQKKIQSILRSRQGRPQVRPILQVGNQ